MAVPSSVVSVFEAAIMVFLFLEPSFVEVKGEKLCSWKAIVKCKTKIKKKKRVMQAVEGDIDASPAMQSELTSKNHSRSLRSLFLGS